MPVPQHSNNNTNNNNNCTAKVVKRSDGRTARTIGRAATCCFLRHLLVLLASGYLHYS